MRGESTSSMFLCCPRKSRTHRFILPGCGRDTNGCTGVIKGWSTAPYRTFRLRTCTSSRSSSTNDVLPWRQPGRSEEHTSELQSQSNLVCRLLLDQKNRAESCCSW